MTQAIQLQTQPSDMGTHVLAPAQLYLAPTPPAIDRNGQPIISDQDDLFCMGILSALGLPSSIHVAVEGTAAALDAMKDASSPKQTQENLTTQATQVKPSWMASFGALELKRKKTDQEQQKSASSRSIRFH